MKVGGLYKFSHVYNGSALNGRLALYVGKAYIHRDDGVVVRNHKILLVGSSSPWVIDKSLITYMQKVSV